MDKKPAFNRQGLIILVIGSIIVAVAALVFLGYAIFARNTPTAQHGATPTVGSTVTTPKPQPTATPTPSPTSTKAGALIFDDEFNGSALDTSKWNIQNRFNGKNDEKEFYLPHDVTISNGSLVITTEQKQFNNFNYTSGEVTTGSNKFSFTYGRLDIRAKLPRGKGIHPALWMLGTGCVDGGGCAKNWPQPNYEEIDIMEMKGEKPTTIYMTIHFTLNGNPKPLQHGCTYTGPDYSQDYHVFSIEWKPGLLEWLIDGTVRCSTKVAVPNSPMFLLMNTAVGTGFGGNVNSSTSFPQEMDIDYVRVYHN